MGRFYRWLGERISDLIDSAYFTRAAVEAKKQQQPPTPRPLIGTEAQIQRKAEIMNPIGCFCFSTRPFTRRVVNGTEFQRHFLPTHQGHEELQLLGDFSNMQIVGRDRD